MTRNTTGISIPKDKLDEIDERKTEAGCTNRSEFMRKAADVLLENPNLADLVE